MAISASEAEELCQQLSPSLYRLALARSRQPADAEDLVQETLVRLLQALDRGDTIANPLHWALRVVSNEVRRRGRHGWRWRSLEDAPVPLGVPTANAGEVVQTRLSNALVAVSMLKPRDRANVVAADIQDWTDSELASVIGGSESGARMRVLRSRQQLALAYMRHAVGFDPQSEDCERTGGLLPRYCVGALDERRTAQLEKHLSQCQSCVRARDDLRQLVRDAVTSLFPAVGDRESRRLSARAVAAWLELRQEPRRPGWLPVWLGRSRADSRRQRRRSALALLLLVLCVPLFGVTPHSPIAPAFQLAVKGLRVGPSPISIAAAKPSPSVSAATAVQRPSPSPLTAPVATDPCPSAPTGAYAYLDKGEVYLRSQVGGAARQLTNTGGLVDYYWWSPNGALIAYKTSSGQTSLGTVRILDLASQLTLATLSQQAVFFSFSPDSSMWVAVAPVVQSTAFQGQPGFTSFQAMVGSVTSGTAQRTFTVAGIPGNAEPWPGNYAELHWVPQTVDNEPWGVYWLPDAIYLDQGMGDQSTHTFTASGDSPDPWTSYYGGQSFQDRLLGIAGNSAFSFKPWTGNGTVSVNCAGRVSQVDSPQIFGPAVTLSVAPDGRTALITDLMIYPCRLDDYLLKADGAITQLDTDCYSSLARWQP